METETFENAATRVVVAILLALVAACAAVAIAVVLTGYVWV